VKGVRHSPLVTAGKREAQGREPKVNDGCTAANASLTVSSTVRQMSDRAV